MNTDNATLGLPLYKCHKEVRALKIAKVDVKGNPPIDHSDGNEDCERETDFTSVITPSEEGYAPFEVSHDYVRKHRPESGGYYVVYEDGYESYSPSVPFENGYTLIER